MIQVYSTNVTVDQNGLFPINAVAANINCNCSVMGSSIQPFKKGIYQVTAVFNLEPAATGDVAVQMNVNGVAKSSGYTMASGTTGETVAMTLIDTIEVANDTCCCKGSPVSLTFENVGAGSVTGRMNVIVKRISA